MIKKDSYLKDMWYEGVVVLVLVLVELLQVCQVLVFTVFGYLMPHLSLLFRLEIQIAQKTEQKKVIKILSTRMRSERKGQELTNKTITFVT